MEIAVGDSSGPRKLAQAATVVLVLVLTGCSTAADREGRDPGWNGKDSGRTLVDVDLLLNWFPEAEHGGYYAALAEGFYEEQGLRVRILPGGPGAPVLPQVASGRVAFGICSADTVLLGWAQEARTVAVFAPLQVSPRCIMVHEESGIRNLTELKHVTLAMNPSSTFSLYLQKKLPLTGVKIVPYSGNVAQFVLDARLAQQAFVFSEPYVARHRGSHPHCLMVSDLGFNPYTSLLITSPEFMRQNPSLVRKMVSASRQGWRHYLTDPSSANRLLGQQNNEMNSEVLDYGAQQLRPLCVTDDVPLDRLGYMTLQRWRTLAEQLIEIGALSPAAVSPQTVFTTEFLTPPAGDEPEPAARSSDIRSPS